MLEKLDMAAIEYFQKLINLHDYKEDGSLSYCDTKNLELLLSRTQDIIENIKIAKENDNQRVLTKYCQYEDTNLTEISSAGFYDRRALFENCFYFLTQMKKQTVHFMENVSLIPGSITIDDKTEESTYTSIRSKFDSDNSDLDMYLDKLICVFYTYFDIGHHIINDAESIVYGFTLIAETAGKTEKVFYEYLRDVGILYSTFVVLDRLTQLQVELQEYERKKEYYLADNPEIPAASWLSNPRLLNLTNLETMLKEGIDTSEIRRFHLLIQRHLDYLETIRYLDPKGLKAAKKS